MVAVSAGREKRGLEFIVSKESHKEAVSKKKKRLKTQRKLIISKVGGKKGGFGKKEELNSGFLSGEY